MGRVRVFAGGSIVMGSKVVDTAGVFLVIQVQVLVIVGIRLVGDLEISQFLELLMSRSIGLSELEFAILIDVEDDIFGVDRGNQRPSELDIVLFCRTQYTAFYRVAGSCLEIVDYL